MIHTVFGIKFNNEEDIQVFLQYFCLVNPVYTTDGWATRLEKITSQCYDIMKNKDVLIVGRNCDNDLYIINSRQNIVDNLYNMEFLPDSDTEDTSYLQKLK